MSILILILQLTKKTFYQTDPQHVNNLCYLLVPSLVPSNDVIQNTDTHSGT